MDDSHDADAIGPSYFVECIFVVLPTTRISNKLKNQDLMASLQMQLVWTE